MTNQKGIANLLAIGLILAVSVVVLASVILYQRSMNEGKQVEANINAVSNTNTTVGTATDLYTLGSGVVIGAGNLRPSTGWNSTDNWLVIENQGPMTDFGLPSYITYDIYNFDTDDLLVTDIQDSLYAPPPQWTGEKTLTTVDQIVDFTGSEPNITERDKTLPSGYEVFTDQSANWKNPIYGEPAGFGEAYSVALSPDQNNIVYVRNTNEKNIMGAHVFLFPRQGASIDQAVNLGRLGYGVESGISSLAWHDNRYVYARQTGEVFDTANGEQVLERRINYQRRYSLISPDSSEVLVIDNEQDKVNQGDYDHESYDFYYIDLPDGTRHDIIKGESDTNAEARIEADWSADGSYIVYSFQNNLWIYDSASGQSRNISTENKNYNAVSLSNDSSKLAVVIDGQVWVYSLNNSDETAGWQAYTNDDLGLSFQHPSDWPELSVNAIVNTGQVVFWPPGGEDVALNGKMISILTAPIGENPIFYLKARSADYTELLDGACGSVPLCTHKTAEEVPTICTAESTTPETFYQCSTVAGTQSLFLIDANADEGVYYATAHIPRITNGYEGVEVFYKIWEGDFAQVPTSETILDLIDQIQADKTTAVQAAFMDFEQILSTLQFTD
ncbi:MAG: DPP IV N-terminal domain-containing protein [Patescibacteria group bacterium]